MYVYIYIHVREMKDRCAFVSSFLPCLQAVCYGSLNGWSRSIGCCNEWPCLGAVLVPLTVPSCSIIRSPFQNLPESSQNLPSMSTAQLAS